MLTKSEAVGAREIVGDADGLSDGDSDGNPVGNALESKNCVQKLSKINSSMITRSLDC